MPFAQNMELIKQTQIPTITCKDFYVFNVINIHCDYYF